MPRGRKAKDPTKKKSKKRVTEDADKPPKTSKSEPDAEGSGGDDDDEDDGIGGIFDSKGNIAPDANEELEREKIKLLLSNFNGDQMSRYEAFRRANVNRSAVKKLANAVLGQSITGNVAVGLSGMSKVFVGEIVEKARDAQARMDPPIEGEMETRPLRPEHFREAWRLYKLENRTVPRAHWRRTGGDGDGMMFR